MSKRELLNELISNQRTQLSEFDIFQRVSCFLYFETQKGEKEIFNTVSLDDRIEMLVDAMNEVFEDADLSEYLDMMNSPIVKKMRALEVPLEQNYNARVLNTLVLMCDDENDMDRA